LAYTASAHVAGGGAGAVATHRHAGRDARAAHVGLHVRATLIPSDEVIVGHPRDGIVELPGAARKVPR
jgi:hypothetical protein